MSVDVSWFIKGRVILLRFEGDVTLKDVQRINREVMIYFHRADSAFVHMILDTTRVGSRYPRNIRKIAELSTAHRHPAMGWLISFGGNPTVLSLIEHLVAQLLGLRYRRVRTMEEALFFLKQVDRTLVEIPPRD